MPTHTPLISSLPPTLMSSYPPRPLPLLLWALLLSCLCGQARVRPLTPTTLSPHTPHQDYKSAARSLAVNLKRNTELREQARQGACGEGGGG